MSTISVAHIYRLRRSSFYRNHTWTLHKTKLATARYGERRRPDPYHKKTFNVDLNFHRLCGFASELIDERGRVRKRYDTDLTPFEKFQSLPGAAGFLGPGVPMAEFGCLRPKFSSGACALSDTAYAQLMQRREAELFDSFTRSGIPCARPLGMG